MQPCKSQAKSKKDNLAFTKVVIIIYELLNFSFFLSSNERNLLFLLMEEKNCSKETFSQKNNRTNHNSLYATTYETIINRLFSSLSSRLSDRKG